MSNPNRAKNAQSYLRMYRQMLHIRTFEDNANQLYLSAKMPDLAHRPGSGRGRHLRGAGKDR